MTVKNKTYEIEGVWFTMTRYAPDHHTLAVCGFEVDIWAKDWRMIHIGDPLSEKAINWSRQIVLDNCDSVVGWNEIVNFLILCPNKKKELSQIISNNGYKNEMGNGRLVCSDSEGRKIGLDEDYFPVLYDENLKAGECWYIAEYGQKLEEKRIADKEAAELAKLIEYEKKPNQFLWIQFGIFVALVLLISIGKAIFNLFTDWDVREQLVNKPPDAKLLLLGWVVIFPLWVLAEIISRRIYYKQSPYLEKPKWYVFYAFVPFSFVYFGILSYLVATNSCYFVAHFTILNGIGMTIILAVVGFIFSR